MIDPAVLRLQWALAYPFPRPEGHFLFVDGRTVPITRTAGEGISDWRAVDGGREVSLRDLLGAERAAAFDGDEYHAVVAVGSNAAPAQLRRKFTDHLGDVAIPVIRITIPDHVIAFARRIAVYGSIPATLIEEAGAQVRAYATLLSQRDYDLMNATEDKGEVYGAMPAPVSDAPEAVRRPFEAYTALAGHLPLRLREFEAHGSALPAGGQWEAQGLAMAELGEAGAVDEFVLATTGSAELARTRDLRLAGLL
ncbi:hypothetical protein FKB34_01060 [Glycocaulis profundi]|nr:hypothetical protein FKB34_01060 [Glycocaulis profundi]